MKNNKRKLVLALTLTLILSSVCTSFAAPAGLIGVNSVSTSTNTGSTRTAYLREDVTVEFNREVLSFKDEHGNPVYPITYGGSTYLPIRAISGLMGEPIEWIARAKNIYIGKTLSRPVKTVINNHDSPYVDFLDIEELESESNDTITLPGSGPRSVIAVREQKNILVMYDFETIEFKNEAKEVIYPINYNGSNYLPLRSVAELMDEEIVWDGNSKTVYIGSMVPIEEVEEEPARAETLAIKELFDKEAEIYNLATSNIAGIAGWTNESAPEMAASISENLAVAQACKNEAAELLKTETFTEAETLAAKKLYEFIEMTEYYILVMENIAYMEAANQDYSMLAETFLDFALASDKAMENAREVIETL